MIQVVKRQCLEVKHTESGAEVEINGMINNFNEEGKIYGFSDYMITTVRKFRLESILN